MFRGYIVALAAALLLSATAHAKANKAVVRAVRGGAAEITKDGKTWKAAKVGDQLGEHSAVKTDANATVDLFLGDNGPVVRVTKDTTLGIDRLDVESSGIEKVIETQLDLRSGTILGNVKKMAAASKYEVKTPVGVAGIRGTEYEISSNGKVKVYTGTVVVVYIVDNVPQPPITVTGGTEVNPPVADGQPARSTPISVTPPDIGELPATIRFNPDGTMVFVDDNGKIIGHTLPDGTIVIEVTTPPQDVTVIVPNDQLPSNFDVTSGPLQTLIADITGQPITPVEPGDDFPGE